MARVGCNTINTDTTISGTGIGVTIVNVEFAHFARETFRACARMRIDHIYAKCFIQTDVKCALVNIRNAVLSIPAGSTRTKVCSTRRLTATATIQARRGSTFVYIRRAVCAGKPSSTITFVRWMQIYACSMRTGGGYTLVGLQACNPIVRRRVTWVTFTGGVCHANNNAIRMIPVTLID